MNTFSFHDFFVSVIFFYMAKQQTNIKIPWSIVHFSLHWTDREEIQLLAMVAETIQDSRRYTLNF